ncbi:MAG TPA: DUF4129 domain-containing protein [Patescibacteria group bacterium]|nr:DUF4129 domain-containing protein [Patescibacteria group bacterium]
MTTRRISRHLPLTALLLSLAFVPGAWAQKPATPAPLDLDSYATQLSRCAAALGGLRRNPAGIARFRQSLPAQWTVRSGGETFRIPTAWLDSALAQIESRPGEETGKWREIEDRIAFLREQAAAMAAPAMTPPAAVAGEKLDAIFRRREFRGLAGPGPLELWWRRLVARVDRGIAWLLARLHLGALSGNVVAYSLIAVALVLLLLWGWRSLAGRMRQAQLEMTVESGPGPAGGRTWAAEALAAAARGEFREAIRCAYWAAVARLEEQGAFPADRSRTPRELLRLLAPGAGERGPFRELTESFELAWYGYRSPSPADWEKTKLQLEKIGCLGISTPQTVSS